MEIYRSPPFLVVHLKRFSHNRSVMFGSRKLSDFVDFPVNNLNLTDFVAQTRSEPEMAGKKFVYDLYAVSNHFGSLGGGHYTAYAKNPLVNKWFNFDDSDVSRANVDEIVGKAAYVLFYKLRE